MEKKITTVREPARDIPVRASADILIVGGGPAGLMAAQAAAGEGLKVMLIESRGYLGGNLTIGLPILGFLGQKDKVVGIDGTEKKVGYLLYMGFNIDYDDELMAAFERFRQQNVTDLILDLRYNNGGDVLSSAVLGTLVAGNDYKGQVYAHTTFNEDRTEAGEGGDYKIGVKETVERIYEPLETALQHAVGLKKIYVLVSQTTASASEMVINGLRGLDIEVNLIGQTTNGKNVGMEGVMRSFYNHEFLLYPVTFYVENAKGFRDYSTGFVPDVEIDDSAIYPGEFGTMEDQLGYIALVWIKSGKKPELQASSLTRGGGSPMKPFGDLWDIRPIRPMGGAVMRPRTDE